MGYVSVVFSLHSGVRVNSGVLLAIYVEFAVPHVMKVGYLVPPTRQTIQPDYLVVPYDIC